MAVTLIIIAIIVLVILMYANLNGALFRNKDNVLRALAGVDANLKRRNDILPLVLALAKDEMIKEKFLIDELYRLLNEVTKLKIRIDTAPDRFSLQEKIDTSLNQLLVAMTNYPNLKTNFNMTDALKSLTQIEAELSENIKALNDAVMALHASIYNFPSSILAKANNAKEIVPYYKRLY